ncbi:MULTISPECIES: pyrroloquinoline quinone biosynthesis peptide chaperone PqqD [Acetobacter]|uniref:Pyrroloquinoline quinone biosynthesis peptide chaperone PqqD n=1 Tax=Acetobacter thailandicus TaxID=1502842 RepID=A0ABT3QBZ0_9PROT|nr:MULTISPECIES: pyrroloquinoline quinone biosynthesis peptide chaperone PqqD [Acetobacter]MBS0985080.1 pyrroloquinoline quinone biosynthesis peptide chaperone PqqD [Acetobacter thailandicus]MBS1003381.1 pyrroloquinoline quinone biosynthesis peptide chaperone PqqD [Acetobacter thailandicus]MCX2562785.1 pyrroloquinoline quinone biosynthesis peptide chaperone PqqD [Acetobacter thailandicus]NHN94850.1 pyrroloquinoline quinone biosynthesis peptide chaperone PqqD [Acetobacter thailandicus]OUJ11567.
MTQADGTFSASTVLRFARGTRLQFDRVRERWFIQAPERVFLVDNIAAEILQLADGERSLGDISTILHEKFTAPYDVILADVLRMTRDLAEKQVLQTV